MNSAISSALCPSAMGRPQNEHSCATVSTFFFPRAAYAPIVPLHHLAHERMKAMDEMFNQCLSFLGIVHALPKGHDCPGFPVIVAIFHVAHDW